MQTKSLFFITPILILLASGCSTINNVKASLADMQTRNLTKKMPDGSIVHFNTNVKPTAAWGCTEVGKKQTYSWAAIQMTFNFQGPYGVLTDKATHYLEANQLSANYVNIGIPTTTSLGISTPRATNVSDLSPNAKATLTFYNCEKVNPDRQLGSYAKSEWDVGVR